MSYPVEKYDRLRQRYFRIYLFGQVSFLAAWTVRLVLRETGALVEWLNAALGGFLLLGVLVLFFSFLGLNKVRRAVAGDPALKDALYDELVRVNWDKAWKSGFLAIAAGLAFFAVFNFVSPVKDVFAFILTAFFAGAAGYTFAFYRLDRS
ncbi:MAG: hypothetical protein OEW18_05600 [Candidatus Aminicenantes bacterium]|nr:hypothetical protein [Candidatus Aminicenantes bacterium]